MSKHYDENFRGKPEYDEDGMKREAIEMFRFLADKSSVKYCSVKRDIRLLIKNKTFYVIALPNEEGDIDNLIQEHIDTDNSSSHTHTLFLWVFSQLNFKQ
jgi:hypothetical protein